MFVLDFLKRNRSDNTAKENGVSIHLMLIVPNVFLEQRFIMKQVYKQIMLNLRIFKLMVSSYRVSNIYQDIIIFNFAYLNVVSGEMEILI